MVIKHELSELVDLRLIVRTFVWKGRIREPQVLTWYKVIEASH